VQIATYKVEITETDLHQSAKSATSASKSLVCLIFARLQHNLFNALNGF
jgi:hypothetical protein